MKLKKILTVTLVAMLFLTSCSKSELQNSKPTSTSQTTTFDNDKGGPPPPPDYGANPAFHMDLGQLNPAVTGGFSWSNFWNPSSPIDPNWPYIIETNVNTGQLMVTTGFCYLGPVEFDELGNEIDPFADATIEVKAIPCGLTESDEYLFGMGVAVSNIDGTFQANHGKMLIYNPATNSMEMGWVLNFTFNKPSSQTCFIIKVTINGNVFYRRISVP